MTKTTKTKKIDEFSEGYVTGDARDKLDTLGPGDAMLCLYAGLHFGVRREACGHYDVTGLHASLADCLLEFVEDRTAHLTKDAVRVRMSLYKRTATALAMADNDLPC